MNLSLTFALMLAASPVMAQDMTGDLAGSDPITVGEITTPIEPYKMCCQPSAPKVGDKWVEIGSDKTQWQCKKLATNDFPTCTPIDRSWHLLTQSYGGTVSLIKDLTKDECEKAKAIFVVPACAMTDGNNAVCPRVMASDSDIKSAECFQ